MHRIYVDRGEKWKINYCFTVLGKYDTRDCVLCSLFNQFNWKRIIATKKKQHTKKISVLQSHFTLITQRPSALSFHRLMIGNAVDLQSLHALNIMRMSQKKIERPFLIHII